MKSFLEVYLPAIRPKSSNTIISYRHTLNIYFNFLKESEGVFCKYLMGENIIPYDTYARICSIEKQKCPEKPEMEILTIGEIKKLLGLPDRKKRTGLRDWFYIALLGTVMRDNGHRRRPRRKGTPL